MAAGLIDHPMSYREYIWMRVFRSNEMREKVNNKIEEMNQEVRIKAAKKTQIKPEKVELMTTKRAVA